MNAHSQNSTDKQSQHTLELLEAIDLKDDISQRHLAQEMGVALGLANSYLKRCVKKGWIKMTTAPANRYLYYLTPNGFAEKARLTSQFLSTSLALFRQSGDEYGDIFESCIANGNQRVLFAGLSDLTEIAYLRSLQAEVEIVGVFQPDASKSIFFDIPVVHKLSDCAEFDQIVMTSMQQTSELVEILNEQVLQNSIIVPSLLISMQYRNDLPNKSSSSV